MSCPIGLSRIEALAACRFLAGRLLKRGCGDSVVVHMMKDRFAATATHSGGAFHTVASADLRRVQSPIRSGIEQGDRVASSAFSHAG